MQWCARRTSVQCCKARDILRAPGSGEPPFGGTRKMTSTLFWSISIRRTTVRTISRLPSQSRLLSPFTTFSAKSSIRLMMSEMFETGRVFSGLPSLLELRQSLLQPRDARGEFGFFDHSFGVAVDKAFDPASKRGRLPIEPCDFLGHGDAVSSRGEATAILTFHPRRVFQQRSHLAPDNLFELVGAHRSIAARR